MNRVAFKMKLFPGFAGEYRRRHDEIWPELRTLLKDAGICDYSIFIDPETDYLFGVMKTKDQKLTDQLPSNAIMQRWWQYMSNIMETNPDSSPVTVSLKEVFYLP